MQVNFLIAGVQKGGTTALYHMLKTHPDVGMSLRKELHFFDDESRNWSVPDYRRLHKFYEPGRAIYGEATPITIFWTAAHERIKAYNRNMRFILLFRDPIERAYSHWCMEYARHCEKLNFAGAIRDGRKRTERRPRTCSYVERGFYGRQIRAMQDHFPDSQFLNLLSDELLDNKAVVLTRIAHFLEISPWKFRDEPVRARTRAPIAYPSIVTREDTELLKNLYAEDLKSFVRATGLNIERWSAAN